MWIRHPLPLITREVPALRLTRDHACLLLQDLHAPFADAPQGHLARRAREKVLTREFDEYFDALELIGPNISRVLARARELGIAVVYSCLGYLPPAEPSALQKAMGWEWDLSGEDGRFPAAWQPREGEPLFAKPGWGALGSAGLEPYLRERGIDTVILVGTMFDFGLRQTAGELTDRGFGCLIVSDAIAALTQVGRTYIGGNVLHGMTKLRSTGELLQLLANLDAQNAVLV
jgi:nicotinamidase-related amidase